MDISGVDLTGQVAIVTGGQFARHVAQALESVGAAVALVVKTERERDELLDLDTHKRLSLVVENAGNRNAIVQSVQNYRDQRGLITLVVNVIDAVEMPVPLWQIDPGEWSNRLESNLRSAFMWTKATLSEMLAGGRIINIADSSMVSGLMSSFGAEAQAHKIKMFSVDPISDYMQESVVLLASGRADTGSANTTATQLRSERWRLF